MFILTGGNLFDFQLLFLHLLLQKHPSSEVERKSNSQKSSFKNFILGILLNSICCNESQNRCPGIKWALPQRTTVRKVKAV